MVLRLVPLGLKCSNTSLVSITCHLFSSNISTVVVHSPRLGDKHVPTVVLHW